MRIIVQIFFLLTLCGIFRPTLLGAQTTFPIAPPPNPDNLPFQHFTDADGLPHPVIHDILQDQQGFIWIATGDGLARFDSQHFKLYQHNPNANSLSSNTVTTLYEASDGSLWIGTRNGVNVLDKRLDQITHYTHDPANPNSLSHNVIDHNSFYEDAEGNMWIGSWGGLNKFDRATAVFTHYQHDPTNANSLIDDTINVIYSAGNGLWIGTANGLDYFDFTSEQFTHYQQEDNRPDSLIHNQVQTLYATPDGTTLWVGTIAGLDRLPLTASKPPTPENAAFTHYRHDEESVQSLATDEVLAITSDGQDGLWVGLSNGGLNHFDPQTETATRFQPIPGDSTSLSSNSVFTILLDKDDGLWVGTEGNWLDYHHPTAHKFELIRTNPFDPTSLSYDAVSGIYVDPQDNVWIAIWGGGLNYWDTQQNSFTRYQHDPNNPLSISSNDTFGVIEDSRGDVWVGTLGGGVNRYNRQSGTFTHFQHNPNDEHSLSHNSVRWVMEDDNGYLWFATIAGGVSRFDPATEQFTNFQFDPTDPQSLCNNQAWAVKQDSQGIIWVTTAGCLHQFDPVTETFKRYAYNPNDPSALGGDTPIQLFEDSNGRYWVTSNNGLDLFDRTTETFTHYTTADGLPSNRVTSILEDERGHLWLGTSRGISHFDPEAKTFRNYEPADGLQGDLFIYPAADKGADGALYFGGSNGLNVFQPHDLPDNEVPPSVILTDFQLFNEPVPIGENSPLPQQISYLDKINLTHAQSDIRFEVAVLNYPAAEKNQLAYMLEGFDPDWTTTSAQDRFIRYTNLDTGIYTLRLKGANNDGVWSETETTLTIKIAAPWWETGWFWSIVLLSLVGAVLLGYQRRISKIEKTNRELEQLVARRTAEVLEQEQSLLAQEERRRLARNLHDSMTQSVHSLGLTAKSAKYLLQKEQYPALADSLDLLSESAQQAYREMRLILYELQVTDDAQTNLIEVLQTRLEKVEEQAGITTQFRADGLGNITKVDEIELFYLLTEMLNNALRHAGANEISITIEGNAHTLTAVVADNGHGFAEAYEGVLTEEQLKYAGMGLQNMMTRIRQLQGTIYLQTDPQTGTKITLTIPSKLLE